MSQELIARIEAASGPDRELDLLIHEAIGKCAHRILHREECDNDGYDLVCTTCGTDITFIKERYTASIDVALTLVPDGHDKWAISGHNAAVVPSRNKEVTHADWTYAATPALALCAAALKARMV